jgi:hypothetical protein
MHEIVDATAMPNWAYVVPKTIGVVLVLLSTLAIGALIAILLQLSQGYTDISIANTSPGSSCRWASASHSSLCSQSSCRRSARANMRLGDHGPVLVISIVIENLGFEHNLYDYGSATEVRSRT